MRTLRHKSIALTFLTIVFSAIACGDGGPGRLDPLGDNDPCPTPGPGITIGGRGDGRNVTTEPINRLVLMGGGSDDDVSARLFVEGAQGGDIVILRATGSLTSYPDYFTQSLSPSPAPASVVTIRTDDPTAGDDLGVICRVNRAEAVWLAGGNQWDYLGRWPDDLHTALVRLTGRGGVVGGTSAGAMSLGGAVFDAEAGSVTSEQALQDPFRAEIKLSYPPFLQPELLNVLVDSHFTERNREGRLLAFLARFLYDKQPPVVVGLGLDEGTALVLEDSSYRVFGPEGKAVWVYRIQGPGLSQIGDPLNIPLVQRARLGPGKEGSWPLRFDGLLFEELQVLGGVIGPAG